MRVSDASQVDGHSLEAQERAFKEHCRLKRWKPVRVYREEGKSAHVDSIQKRPVFRQMLDDAGKKPFDVVVVHTFDRFSRNLKVMLEAMSILGKADVGLVSITENIDYSTPHGRFATQTLGSVAELYSGRLATHVKKGISERARKGMHLGGVPFGYMPCKQPDGSRCDPEHPGGVHIIPQEAEAVAGLFRRYATGQTTLADLATWLNQQGFRTRN
ncbi:MAG: recombinase family protein, partial [Dehalococcoidia bacterium]|nr:recombinase family protein [Dehalococcoidia bacterium]